MEELGLCVTQLPAAKRREPGAVGQQPIATLVVEHEEAIPEVVGVGEHKVGCEQSLRAGDHRRLRQHLHRQRHRYRALRVETNVDLHRPNAGTRDRGLRRMLDEQKSIDATVGELHALLHDRHPGALEILSTPLGEIAMCRRADGRE